MEERLCALLASGVEPAFPVLTNSIGMRLALLPPGTFVMGASGEAHGSENESPAHVVTLTRAFYLGVYEVTQKQYHQVTGASPSHFSSEGAGREKVAGLDTRSFPVESTSHDDAVNFCARLSDLPEEKRARRVYRLPTEAEWEYACRAGTSTPFHFGARASSRQANFDGHYPFGGAEKGPYPERPVPVGSYVPSSFGLHDMHGNVWEWCSDRYSAYPKAKKSAARVDPQGPSRGANRVQRGGSWFSYGWACRAAQRCSAARGTRHERAGFRVALTPPGG
jgi:formylglycine-generating enzyme required for sulfatase activity